MKLRKIKVLIGKRVVVAPPAKRSERAVAPDYERRG
jgi:hypothetical protein